MSDDQPAVPASGGAGSEVEEQPVDAVVELRALRRKCTPKQRKWLAQIPLTNFQQWSAAKELGFSKDTIHRWKRLPHIQRYLELSKQAHIDELDLNEVSILAGYLREERADMRELFDGAGKLKQPQDWPADIARCVVEYGFDQNGNPKVKLADQRGARDRLAKYLKMFIERHELTGKDGQPLQSLPPVVNVIIDGDEKD